MQGLNNAVALDFDYREQMIYWTDVTTQGSMIRRMHLNGSNVQVSPGQPTPQLTTVGVQRSSLIAPPHRALFQGHLPTHLPQLFSSPPSLLNHYMTAGPHLFLSKPRGRPRRFPLVLSLITSKFPLMSDLP